MTRAEHMSLMTPELQTAFAFWEAAWDAAFAELDEYHGASHIDFCVAAFYEHFGIKQPDRKKR